MKKILVIILVCTGVFFGCNKKEALTCPYSQSDLNNTYAPGGEVNALTQYIEHDSIDAIQDPRGFYYKIDTTGGYSKPLPCANITINYVGTLTSGKVFDQAKDVQFNLADLIIGWKIGVPLVGKNGKVTLYLPPSFAYGANEINGIPPNSILIFSIELINFSNP
ncbi:FKBP-type peptidylprolyl isomerase [Taibaiella lutea]|uniref:Peptidyl-prolyl cis-trans isomerase n=1 Tax=Taibaiella lutea TaxID=2608001 RepID=A0A5M6CEJ3_9BACT|nr:FKBP-type peptidyl-prolyl cis-trans isomerase [Taibaiella lutea]KAA5533594.1 FKBP-type peptidylprolyl isomerase [Taibaiella lutea]